VTEFYERSTYPHRDIRLSEDGEVNVSNPTGKKGGGRGVFAVRDIPSGTTLCPYVNVVQKKRCQDEACEYCLMLRPGLYLCARNIRYDEGYFAACHVALLSAERRWSMRCAPCRLTMGVTSTPWPGGQVLKHSIANSRRPAMGRTFASWRRAVPCLLERNS
jgi:hypothetical protein